MNTRYYETLLSDAEEDPRIDALCNDLWEWIKTKQAAGGAPDVLAVALMKVAAKAISHVNIPRRIVVRAFREAIDAYAFDAVVVRNKAIEAKETEIQSLKTKIAGLEDPGVWADGSFVEPSGVCKAALVDMIAAEEAKVPGRKVTKVFVSTDAMIQLRILDFGQTRASLYVGVDGREVPIFANASVGSLAVRLLVG